MLKDGFASSIKFIMNEYDYYIFGDTVDWYLDRIIVMTKEQYDDYLKVHGHNPRPY